MKGVGSRVGVKANRGAPCHSSVGAAGEHDVAEVRAAARRAERINISASLIRGTIHRDPSLPQQSARIRRAAEELAPAKVHGNSEVELERNGAVGGVGRAVEPKLR